MDPQEGHRFRANGQIPFATGQRPGYIAVYCAAAYRALLSVQSRPSARIDHFPDPQAGDQVRVTP